MAWNSFGMQTPSAQGQSQGGFAQRNPAREGGGGNFGGPSMDMGGGMTPSPMGGGFGGNAPRGIPPGAGQRQRFGGGMLSRFPGGGATGGNFPGNRKFNFTQKFYDQYGLGGPQYGEPGGGIGYNPIPIRGPGAVGGGGSTWGDLIKGGGGLPGGGSPTPPDWGGFNPIDEMPRPYDPSFMNQFMTQPPAPQGTGKGSQSSTSTDWARRNPQQPAQFDQAKFDEWVRNQGGGRLMGGSPMTDQGGTPGRQY